MIRNSYIAVAVATAALFVGFSAVFAQSTTFQTYHCGDGTEFIVGFYPYDSRAYLQIDGGSIMLPRRLSISGTRYSARGITLKISKAGRTTVKRPKRPETACQVT
jgi:membrane-bound inhibitor of C-type lysozyme